MDKFEIINAIARWVEIREQTGYAKDHDITGAEVQHSALLNRLLDGTPPLPDPPPRAFSYPWYELIEKGHSTCMLETVTIKSKEFPSASWDNPVVFINQTLWEFVGRKGDTFVVTHIRAPGNWEVSPSGEGFGWTIRRLD